MSSVKRDLPLTARIAWLSARDYAVTVSAPILLWSVLLRGITQVMFFTLLGEYLGGAQGRHYAFVGAITFAAVTPTVIKITGVLTEERMHGTLYRLRLGRIPILTVMILRSWVYVVEGIAAATIALLIAGPVLVGTEQVSSLIPVVPMLTVIALSCAGLGLFAATLATDHRVVHLIANTLAYLILLTSGAIVPPGRYHLLDAAGAILPMRHGLAAIRTGQPSLLGYELMVGIGWLALAGLCLAIQAHRARAHGLDDLS